MLHPRTQAQEKAYESRVGKDHYPSHHQRSRPGKTSNVRNVSTSGNAKDTAKRAIHIKIMDEKKESVMKIEARETRKGRWAVKTGALTQ